MTEAEKAETMIRICVMRDGPCPHGMQCPYVGDGPYGYPCKDGWNRRPAPVEAVDAEPVAWRWRQLMQDSMGGWETKMERNDPRTSSWIKPANLRDVEPLYSAATLATLQAENEKLKESEARMLLHIGDLARQMGEAEGKLAASELPGIVNGWKERTAAAESLVSDLRKELERLKKALRFYAEGIHYNGSRIVEYGDIARAALTPKEKTDD